VDDVRPVVGAEGKGHVNNHIQVDSCLSGEGLRFVVQGLGFIVYGSRCTLRASWLLRGKGVSRRV
jgi:hypothetical protein